MAFSVAPAAGLEPATVRNTDTTGNEEGVRPIHENESNKRSNAWRGRLGSRTARDDPGEHAGRRRVGHGTTQRIQTHGHGANDHTRQCVAHSPRTRRQKSES